MRFPAMIVLSSKKNYFDVFAFASLNLFMTQDSSLRKV